MAKNQDRNIIPQTWEGEAKQYCISLPIELAEYIEYDPLKIRQVVGEWYESLHP